VWKAEGKKELAGGMPPNHERGGSAKEKPREEKQTKGRGGEERDTRGTVAEAKKWGLERNLISTLFLTSRVPSKNPEESEKLGGEQPCKKGGTRQTNSP